MFQQELLQPNLFTTEHEGDIDSPQRIRQVANCLSHLSTKECFEIMKTPFGQLLKNAWNSLNPKEDVSFLSQEYTDIQNRHKDLLLGYWKGILLYLSGERLPSNEALHPNMYNNWGILGMHILSDEKEPPFSFSYRIFVTAEDAEHEFDLRFNPKTLTVDFGAYFPRLKTSVKNAESFECIFRKRRLTYMKRRISMPGIDGLDKVVKVEELRIAPY